MGGWGSFNSLILIQGRLPADPCKYSQRAVYPMFEINHALNAFWSQKPETSGNYLDPLGLLVIKTLQDVIYQNRRSSGSIVCIR